MKRSWLAVFLTLAGLAAAATAQSPAPAQAGVAYWTTTYAGEDLTSGKFDCRPPVIPAVSKTNSDIAATNKAIAAWEACYNGFVENMNDAMPAGKRIPAEVRATMTPEQLEQARAHLDEVYGKVIERAQASADATLAQRDAWRSETSKFVAERNNEITRRNEADKIAMENERRRIDVMQTEARAAAAPVQRQSSGH